MTPCGSTYTSSKKKEEIRYCDILSIEWVKDQDWQLSAKKDSLYSNRLTSIDMEENKRFWKSFWNCILAWKPDLCSQMSHCSAFQGMFVWGLFCSCEQTAACPLTAKAWCSNILQPHNSGFGIFPLRVALHGIFLSRCPPLWPWLIAEQHVVKINKVS